MIRVVGGTLALLLGCGGAAESTADVASDAASAVSRDSAGITIREYSEAAWASAPSWRLDAEPVVTIDGGDNPEFDLTHAEWLTPVSRGRTVVVTTLPPRVMLFDSLGAPVRVVATSGEGPGDVRMPSNPLRVGEDSLLLIDATLDRMTILSPDGTILEQRPLGGETFAWCEPPLGPLPGNRLITVVQCFGDVREGEPLRPPAPVLIRDFDLGVVDTAVVLAGGEHAWGLTSPSARKPTGLFLRYGRRQQAAVWDTMIVTGDGERGFELEVRDPSGQLREILRVAGPQRPVTEAMRQAWTDRDLARVERDAEHGGNDPELLAWRARNGPYADSLPPHGALRPGAGGLLWVVDAETLADTSWAATAFARDGRIVGRLVGPRAGRPMWFGADRVIVREVDGDGVVRFGVYRFRRSGQ
ncbi:MAG: hypothetical protein KC485_08110 [Gemmatimonadetes bacterium]|nr:hypothetical protein [Gemmatimonadota bacterium]